MEQEKIKIVIFGTGAVAAYFYRQIDWDRVWVTGYVDSYQNGQELNGIPVYPEEQIPKLSFEYLVIACGSVTGVKERLKEVYGVQEDCLVGVLADEESLQEELNWKVNRELSAVMNYAALARISRMKLPRMYGAVMWYQDKLPGMDTKDYIREQTLYLLAEEINRKGLKGSIAELGVYKGEFSRIIGQAFPDKRFYLYDTFEGFGKKDVAEDFPEGQRGSIGSSFQHTEAESVVEKIVNPDRVVVKQGYFPETYDFVGGGGKRNIQLCEH